MTQQKTVYAMLLALGLIGGSFSAVAANEGNVIKFVFHNNLDSADKPGYPTKDKCPKYWDGNRCVCPAGSIMTSDGCVTSCTPGEDCPDEDKAVCYNDSDCQNCEHSCVNAKCVYEQKLYCDGDKVKYDKTSGPRPNCTPPLPVTAQDCAALGEGYTCSEQSGKAQCVAPGAVQCSPNTVLSDDGTTCCDPNGGMALIDGKYVTYWEDSSVLTACGCPQYDGGIVGEVGSDGKTCCWNGYADMKLDGYGEINPAACGCPDGGTPSADGEVCCKDGKAAYHGSYNQEDSRCSIGTTCPDGGQYIRRNDRYVSGQTCCKDGRILDNSGNYVEETVDPSNLVDVRFCSCPNGGTFVESGGWNYCCKNGKRLDGNQEYTLDDNVCGGTPTCPDGYVYVNDPNVNHGFSACCKGSQSLNADGINTCGEWAYTACGEHGHMDQDNETCICEAGYTGEKCEQPECAHYETLGSDGKTCCGPRAATRDGETYYYPWTPEIGEICGCRDGGEYVYIPKTWTSEGACCKGRLAWNGGEYVEDTTSYVGSVCIEWAESQGTTCPNGGIPGSDGETCCKDGLKWDGSSYYWNDLSVCGCNEGEDVSLNGAYCCKNGAPVHRGDFQCLGTDCDAINTYECPCPNGGTKSQGSSSVCCKNGRKLDGSNYSSVDITYCGCPDGGEEMPGNWSRCCKNGFEWDGNSYSNWDYQCGCPDGGEQKNGTCCKDGKELYIEGSNYGYKDDPFGRCQ